MEVNVVLAEMIGEIQYHEATKTEALTEMVP